MFSTILPRWLTLAFIVALALWLRTCDLERRPMHADEANQAVKLGELIEHGSYAFDPRDHHGPTLYFAAVPVAWLRGQRTLADLDERTIRLVPALFGTASVVLLAAFATLAAGPKTLRTAAPGAVAATRPLPSVPGHGVGSRMMACAPRWPALAAAAFLAVSPPSVYFSRYFIQETLLVTFTLAALYCGLAWQRRPARRWAILAGVSVGLMQATKASAPLFLALALLAGWIARRATRDPSPSAFAEEASTVSAVRSRRAALGFALGAFVFTTVLLYSSFFTHFRGVGDALSAYSHAFTRFGAEAAPTGHEKPWWYYVNLFGWYRTGGLTWHQLALATLALTGMVVVLCGRVPASFGSLRFGRFTAVFTVLVLAVFSAFAYKTPWHVVHFVPGLCLLAAIALAAVARLRTGRVVAWAFALLTTATLYQQTQRVAFFRPADQRNPYAYVHSSPDVLKYRARAMAAISIAPSQPIRVITPEYWPLPWYLRGIPHVGYYATAPDDADGALLIVAPELVESVRTKLKGRYTESFLGLRPGVLLVLFTAET